MWTPGGTWVTLEGRLSGAQVLLGDTYGHLVVPGVVAWLLGAAGCHLQAPGWHLGTLDDMVNRVAPGDSWVAQGGTWWERLWGTRGCCWGHRVTPVGVKWHLGATGWHLGIAGWHLGDTLGQAGWHLGVLLGTLGGTRW